MRGRAVKRPFLLSLAALAVGIAAIAGCKARPKPIPDGPLKVTVATPKVDKIETFTDLTGTVAAVDSVQVRPRVSGFIKTVPLEARLKDESRKDERFMVDDKTLLFEIVTGILDDGDNVFAPHGHTVQISVSPAP